MQVDGAYMDQQIATKNSDDPTDREVWEIMEINMS